VFDPFVYLGVLATQTKNIALGLSSIVLPIRHPAHVAKAAASSDVLSGGRLILGVASGDRLEEYPALNLNFNDRGKRFRESVDYIKHMWQHNPSFDNDYGHSQGQMDFLPKPYSGKLPLFITGGSKQSPEWIANNGDGWMLYPRNIAEQAPIVHGWHERLIATNRGPQHIHLGFRCGVKYLHHHLTSLEKIGVNHVALNLRFNQADMESTLQRLANELLPSFS